MGRAAGRRRAQGRRAPPMGDPRAKPPQDARPVPPEMRVLLQEQSSQPFSSLSALLLPPCCGQREALLQSWTADKQWVDGSDACAECYGALVQGLQYVDNPAGGKVDPAAVRSSALHPWPHHNGEGVMRPARTGFTGHMGRAIIIKWAQSLFARTCLQMLLF